MLNNENIICISTIDWDFNWQGHQEIMSVFAKNGNRVLFIENTGVRVPGLRDISRLKKRLINWFKGIKGFREERGNLYIYSPLILPFPYSRLARWINRNFLFGSLRKWIKLMGFQNAIVWTFLPTGIALDIIDELNYKCLVYYCIADFNELVDNLKKVSKSETAVIKKCDIIFAQGEIFKEKCQKFNDNVHIFPFGININIFGNNEKYLRQYNFDDIKKVKKPIIGYIGGIHRHIDFALLAYLAMQNPDWSLVLVGPIQTDISSLKEIPNIIFLDKKDFPMLPGYIREFDVCIIPYINSEFTKTVYPTKLNEYHALGRPVVATDLPEVVSFNKDNENLVLIARTKEEFAKRIQEALGYANSDLVKRRIALAKRHSWDIRIEEMSNLIEAIAEKKISAYSGWQIRFRGIYRVARRRFMKTILSAVVLWLLVFYTPVIWWIAEPLKITNPSQKADAIVVFAGGVGESGRPGQGYEERVNYAVGLYKNGFAKDIILSSGAITVFPETYIMKTLAVSLGVPENVIWLEDKAASNYQNVKYSLAVINKNSFNKIILISSAYNMRRSFLIFKKLAPEKSVICSPVADAQFYKHGGFDERGKKVLKQINITQIKAICHEYVAILYYWYKGYI